MAEPAPSVAFIVVSAAVAVLGPVLGPFALLLFGAIGGAFLALSAAGTMTRLQGVWYVVTAVVVSLGLSGLCVWLLERHTSIPGNLALIPVAFVIAAARDHLGALVKRIAEAVGDAITAILTRRGGQ